MGKLLPCAFQLHELWWQGRDVSQAIVEFAKREDIDILIMGEVFHQQQL